MNSVTLHRSGESAEEHRPTRLVSVLSGKGGVGKSVLALNLAERLAFQGRRTLVVDADFGCGNLHILANRDGRYGVQEYAEETLTLREAVTTVEPYIDLLAAVPGTMNPDTLDTYTCVRLVQRLRDEGGRYDCILVDHASGRSNLATAMALAGDVSVIVLVPELTSISDAYGLFKQLGESDMHLDGRLLINRVADADEGNHIYQKFCALAERFLGRVPACLGYVREDQQVKTAVAGQTFVARIAAEAPVVQTLTIAARNLATSSPTTTDDSRHPRKRINETLAAADIKE